MGSLARLALSIGASAALLPGCGGVQPPIGAPGAGPLAVAPSAIGLRGGSRMKRGATASDLLYVSNSGNMFVYTYPGTQSVGTVSGRLGYGGLCSDAQGNVFTEEVTASGFSSTIFEYSHDGTTPIATFADPGIAFGCAIDPTSGNLAVANFEDSNNPDDVGDVAVYPAGMGTPTIYVNQRFFTYYFCGYDGEGNLFISALLSASNPLKPVLVRLAKGSNSLTRVNLKTRLFWGSGVFYPSLQWDGQYMTVSSVPKIKLQHSSDFEFVVYRLSIKGNTATIVGTTTLKTNARNDHVGQVWIQGNTLLAPFIKKGQRVGLWAYPTGGSPSKTITVEPETYNRLWGLTISVPPSGEL